VVRNIPLDMAKEELQRKIEEHFANAGTKVVYVNYCYNISQIVEWNKKISELYKH
jgi:hypothetical protein